MSERVLVTGVAGFIGSHLAEGGPALAQFSSPRAGMGS
jgi:hypothetical protein